MINIEYLEKTAKEKRASILYLWPAKLLGVGAGTTIGCIAANTLIPKSNENTLKEKTLRKIMQIGGGLGGGYLAMSALM